VIGWAPRLSPEAEHAIRSVHRARVLVGRTRLLALPSSAPDAYRAEANAVGVVMAFAVLDSYLSTRADFLLHRDLPLPSGGTALESFVHSNVGRTLRGSVRQLIEYWNIALGVNIEKNAPNWPLIKEQRELRNLIVHSLRFLRPHGGTLGDALAKRVRNLGFDPDTYVGQIPAHDADFDRLALWVEEVVAWIDKERP